MKDLLTLSWTLKKVKVKTFRITLFIITCLILSACSSSNLVKTQNNQSLKPFAFGPKSLPKKANFDKIQKLSKNENGPN